jgi:hypothetical protein
VAKEEIERTTTKVTTVERRITRITVMAPTREEALRIAREQRINPSK